MKGGGGTPGQPEVNKQQQGFPSHHPKHDRTTNSVTSADCTCHVRFRHFSFPPFRSCEKSKMHTASHARTHATPECPTHPKPKPAPDLISPDSGRSLRSRTSAHPARSRLRPRLESGIPSRARRAAGVWELRQVSTPVTPPATAMSIHFFMSGAGELGEPPRTETMVGDFRMGKRPVIDGVVLCQDRRLGATSWAVYR